MGIRYAEEKKAAPAGAAANYSVTANGKTFNVSVNGDKVTVNGKAFDVKVGAAGAAAAAPAAAGSGKETEVTSPLPGTVVKVVVNEGDTVADGATLMIVEAMKMEQEVKCGKGGKVVKIMVGPKDVIEADQVIALIEE